MKKCLKAVLLIWVSSGLLFLTTKASAEETRLFLDDAPLSIELQIDLGNLCWKSKRRSCEDGGEPAKLIYTDAGDDKQVLDVLVETRGKWRKKGGECSMPHLFVDFSPSVTENTLFESQGKLPLTTHCRKSPGKWQQYILREYLAYRIYNLITDKSVRVRLLQITYRNPSSSDNPPPLYAFVSEHFLSVAKRNNAKLEFLSSFDTMDADATELAKMDLFQFLIGNTDWSVVKPHNIAFLSPQNGPPVPMPYDFDFSGLVSSAYATPPKKLRLKSVKKRLFRGFCREDTNWADVFSKFLAERDNVYELLDNLPGMTDRSRDVTRRFLESFYKILDSPEERKRLITDACR